VFKVSRCACSRVREHMSLTTRVYGLAMSEAGDSCGREDMSLTTSVCGLAMSEAGDS
jgi:hypothetical protein